MQIYQKDLAARCGMDRLSTAQAKQVETERQCALLVAKHQYHGGCAKEGRTEPNHANQLGGLEGEKQ